MDEDPEDVEDVVQLLERMPQWLKGLAKWLDEWSPMLARAIKPAYEFGGAFLLGGVIALLLIVIVMKFGVHIFGQFVKRDAFPVVVATIAFVFPAVSVIALMHIQGVWRPLGGLAVAMVSAMKAHKMAVDRRDYMRKKDLAAGQTS